MIMGSKKDFIDNKLMHLGRLVWPILTQCELEFRARLSDSLYKALVRN